MGKKKRIVERLLFVAYLATIAVLCFSRMGGSADLSGTLLGIPKDKVVHFIMFLPFLPIVYFAFYTPKGRACRFVLFLVLALVVAMIAGGAIELIQGTLKYRSADIMDFRADSLGALTGAFLVLIFAVVKKKW